MTLVVFVILCKICVRFLLLASSGGFLLPGAQRGFFTAERGAGTPSPPQSPRKDFCRAKMPCGGERLPNLLLGSLIVVRTANRVAIAIQNESTNKKP